MKRIASSLALAFLVSACGLFGIGAKKEVPKNEDENAKAFAELEKNDRDDDAGAPAQQKGPEKPKGPIYPAPFTAEQIRDATKNGRTYRYKIETPGKPAKEYSITFRNVDEAGAEIHSGSAPPRRLAWRLLQQDSEFPKDKTKTHPEKLATPAGKFECTVYEVSGEDGEVWTFYFAKKLPGAPVFFYAERNGRRLRTTTLVDHIAGK